MKINFNAYRPQNFQGILISRVISDNPDRSTKIRCLDTDRVSNIFSNENKQDEVYFTYFGLQGERKYKADISLPEFLSFFLSAVAAPSACIYLATAKENGEIEKYYDVYKQPTNHIGMKSGK